MASSVSRLSPETRPLRAERRSAQPVEAAMARLRSETGLRDAPREALTRLPERSWFVQRVRQALARGADHDVAILVLDVDGFQRFNQDHGFEAGDRLLRAVGDAITAAIRAGDVATRLGNDEFAVLLEDVPPRDVLRVAMRLADVIGRGVVAPAAATVSAGLAVRTPAMTRAEDLLLAASRTLERSRVMGGGPAFQTAPDDRAAVMADLEIALRRAVDGLQFRSHYQPSLAPKAGSVAGFEVVLWKRSSR
jgi:diguanylate cyclase (GGDEF)-like protein